MTNTNTNSPRTINHAVFNVRRLLLLGLVGSSSSRAAVPEFDPGSLVDKTRVLGARIEVDGAPDRAAPLPGEVANISWLVTSPGASPPLAWAFAACLPGAVGGSTSLGCAAAPLAYFDGTASPPRISIQVRPRRRSAVPPASSSTVRSAMAPIRCPPSIHKAGCP